MLSPRWRKALRDLWGNKSRTVLVILAIAIGIIGIGSILNAYSILTREMQRNFLETNPASAVFFLDDVDAELVQIITDRPDVAVAEARRTLFSCYQIGENEWINIMLFVIADFTDLRIATFFPEEGNWNPQATEILIERSGINLIEQGVGESAMIKIAGNPAQAFKISGIVHDPGQAPSWMEGFAYGYITLAGLEQLGEQPVLTELRVVMAENHLDLGSNRVSAATIKQWLVDNGYQVKRLSVPIPDEHPHNSQMITLLFILESFGILALLLSGLLVTTLISALMEQQVRQIGVMKTFGAKMSQIAGIYLATVIFLGVIALFIGIPLGGLAGRSYANFAATTLNFEIASYAVDSWVYVVLVAVGLLIPVIGAAYPIIKGARITVREAISADGSSSQVGIRPIDNLLGQIRGLKTIGLLALRNTFRRLGRLGLTLIALAIGGAVFMSSLSVGASWNKTTEREFEARHYDAEIRLKQPYEIDQIADLLERLPAVTKVETWLEVDT